MCIRDRIHSLQLGSNGASFGNEFRRREKGRLEGAVIDFDYGANARSFGCKVFAADDPDTLRHALHEARRATKTSVIVVHAEPRRGLLSSGAFWDLGVPETSDDPEVATLSAHHLEQRRACLLYTSRCV